MTGVINTSFSAHYSKEKAALISFGEKYIAFELKAKVI